MAQPKPSDELRKGMALWRRHEREKQLGTSKYPNCQGTFPDCPKEGLDVTNPLDICKSCYIYKERSDKFRTTNSTSETNKLKEVIKRMDLAIILGLAKEEDKKEFVDKLKKLEEK